jgi:hypothetical protein
LRRLPNAWFEKIQQVAKRGTPDFLGVVNSYFVALELKSEERSRPNALQDYVLDRICSLGQGLTFVPHPGNWDDVYSLLSLLATGRITPAEIKRMKIYGDLQ